MSTLLAPAPVPDSACVSVRPAVPGDWTFLDHLQRLHHHAIGFLSRAALGEAIDRGRVLLALENGAPAGYLYAAPRYHRRADVAVIYQAAVSFDARRRHLGTGLVRAFADRLPATVGQVSLWCAADLEAGGFWSALGFAPVATRAGARNKRTHVFWCCNPRYTGSGAAEAFWVPEATRGGVVRAARAVTRLAPARDEG
ncbi:GNAT family N-acetyltransferase [Gemmata sp. JC717]|uniref:GNAT family N-acetyltransferase n=1 Tax=Gemmata algarum TaxID=2975278 RepID=UPI0021BB25A2|nr:GNAT family N-acetyltransferase [Gemmata algarum]MDY3554776.1 GNAT family N-acetyltransferase [Gemmata algarum]